MAQPTFIQEAETAWTTNANGTASVATGSFNVLAGDVLVAITVTADSQYTTSVSGGTLVWTQQQAVVVAAYTYVAIYTAIVDTDKAMTVTFTRAGSGGNTFYGGNCLTFRASDGIGGSNKGNNTTGDPTVTVTTVQDDSAIVMVVGDWNATDGATRAYNTAAGGTFTEQTYFRDSNQYTLYGGYYANVGAAGGQAVGITDPNGMKWAIAAVEVKGTGAGGGATGTPRRWRMGFMGVQ